MSPEVDYAVESERAPGQQRSDPFLPTEAIAAPGPAPLSVAGVLALQRSIGNQAVARMMAATRSSNVVARCAGGCAGSCSCSETDEAELLERERPGGPLAKQQSDGLEAEDAQVGDVPVQVVQQLVPEDEAGTDPNAAQPTAGEPTPAPDNGALGKTIQVSATEVEPGPDRSLSGPALLSKATTSVASGATPSNALGAGVYGLTFPESIAVTMGAKKVGSNWQPVVSALAGAYSLQTRLLPGQSEVTGPGGNSTGANYCSQVKGLKTLGNTAGNPWYMISAVTAHEDVHATRFGPALVAAEPTITAALEAVTIPDVTGMTQAAAVAALSASAAFKAAVTAAVQTWLAQILTLVAGDHAAGGPTDVAEHGIVDPMVTNICTFSKTPPPWPPCADCPP